MVHRIEDEIAKKNKEIEKLKTELKGVEDDASYWEVRYLKLGVGVLLMQFTTFSDKNSLKVVLGRRLSKAGYGTYAPSGGRVDRGEDLVEAAVRETKEEIGLKLSNIFKIECFAPKKCAVDGVWWRTHYFGSWLDDDADLKVMEPHKCEGWGLFDWNNLPSPLFPPFKQFVDSVNLDTFYYYLECEKRIWGK
jgi:8-oxo-dGTP diphosphatase